jgi:hypothetical protein
VALSAKHRHSASTSPEFSISYVQINKGREIDRHRYPHYNKNKEEEEEEEETPLSASAWVLMAADKSWMTAPGLLDRAEALEPPQPGPAWTDDFNNMLSAIRAGELSK